MWGWLLGKLRPGSPNIGVTSGVVGLQLKCSHTIQSRNIARMTLDGQYLNRFHGPLGWSTPYWRKNRDGYSGYAQTLGGWMIRSRGINWHEGNNLSVYTVFVTPEGLPRIHQTWPSVRALAINEGSLLSLFRLIRPGFIYVSDSLRYSLRISVTNEFLLVPPGLMETLVKLCVVPRGHWAHRFSPPPPFEWRHDVPTCLAGWVQVCVEWRLSFFGYGHDGL